MNSWFFGYILLCSYVNLYQVHGYVPLILNVKLSQDYIMDAVSNGELHRCADACVYQNDCLSVSFSKGSRDCEMYNVTTIGLDEDGIVQQNDTVLVEVEHWPWVRTAACWDKPCGEKMVCVPHGQSFRCHKEDKVGCKSFGLPEHGIFGGNTGNTSVYMHPYRSTILAKCQLPYVTKLMNPERYWIIRCIGNHVWSYNYTCYTVEELCVHEILEKFYPALVNITVTSAVSGWQEDNVFLNSTSGWTPSVHDDQQYIELDFNDTYWIGGLITKGGFDGNWVIKYDVSYSKNCREFISYGDAEFELNENFYANTDAISSVKNIFQIPIRVKCLRIHPITYRGGISMRLEVLACKDYDIQ